MKIINKTIWQKKGRFELFFAAMGFSFGLTLLLITTQFYFDIKTLFTSRDDYSRRKYSQIVINKKITLGHSIKALSTGFGKEEIDSITKQKFVIKSGPIFSNSFKVSALIGFGSAAYQTELFFESLPDKFLIEKPDNWEWSAKSDFLPILISRDFLALYNFGFASSRNLPVLSPETINLISFNIEISGPGGRRLFTSKIVGLTDTVSSIIVPYNFMTWANKKIGLDENKTPTRLILSITDKSDPALSEFLYKNNYETGRHIIGLSEAKNLLKILFAFTGGLGLSFVLLSIVIFVLNLQLVITGAAGELKLLLLLGYKKSTLVFSILSILFAILLFSTISGILLSTFTIKSIHHVISGMGHIKLKGINPLIFLVPFLSILSTIVVSYTVTKKILNGKTNKTIYG